jgi:hypothetical protein
LWKYNTCANSAYHHSIGEFESRSWRGVLDATLFDKVFQRLATSQWFFPGIPVSSTNKTDRHDITEILWKVALNSIIITLGVCFSVSLSCGFEFYIYVIRIK